jgi:antitoxin ChpS
MTMASRKRKAAVPAEVLLGTAALSIADTTLHIANLLPAAREALSAFDGTTMKLAVDGDRVVLRTITPRPKYTLAQLTAECDPIPLTDEDREWLEAPPVGREVW